MHMLNRSLGILLYQRNGDGELLYTSWHGSQIVVVGISHLNLLREVDDDAFTVEVSDGNTVLVT